MHPMRLGIALLVLSSPLTAATGNFHFGKVTFQPVDVFAYQAETKDPAKPITIVVLTSYKIDRPAVLAAIEPSQSFIMQGGEKGSTVFVRLVAPDHCGVAGFLGPTYQQIDLGESFALKTNASTPARVAGECATTKPGKMFDDAYDFKLPFDAAITAIPKPTPLPADGGDPGKSYVALVKAIQTSDWNAAHVRLPKEQAGESKPTDMKFFFEGLALNYPKSVTATGGLMKGDLAQIDIRGIHHDGHKIKGVVAMKKVAGTWQVIDQSLFTEQ